MLFFFVSQLRPATHSHLLPHQVGVSVMADKVKSLDQYTRNFIAPLGLFFPFPHHCSKLDSYLRRAPELRGCGITGGLRAAALPNKKFWSEWKSLVVSMKGAGLLWEEFDCCIHRTSCLQTSLTCSTGYSC